MKTWLRGDWLKWVAAGFALVATASAEYELARAIGMNQYIAAAVPGALDAYVVRALRAHREVLTAVIAMVAVNAASHLVTAGLLPVEWQLITAVSAIAPLVLWRVHALGTPGEWRERKIWDTEHMSTPQEPGTVSVPEAEHKSLAACPCEHGRSEWDLCVCLYSCSVPCGESSTDEARVLRDCPVFGCEHGAGHVGECLILPPVPEHAPDLRSTEPSTPESTRVLHLVTEPEHAEVDADLVERARVLMGQEGRVPVLRVLKKELRLGTTRAQEVQDVLRLEHDQAHDEAQEGKQ